MRPFWFLRSHALGPALLVLSALSPLAAPLHAEAKDKDKTKDKSPTDPGAAQSANECAKVQASARYVGYGYTHLITLHNTCRQRVECSLWTDVDPEPRTTVQADTGQTAEVVTRRGSPSREVTAYKSCSFR
ncbi:MAG: hypothetical protein RLZZ450_4535 [Pseudomonadota bacterium]